jgi:hypothetical protein
MRVVSSEAQVDFRRTTRRHNQEVPHSETVPTEGNTNKPGISSPDYWRAPAHISDAFFRISEPCCTASTGFSSSTLPASVTFRTGTKTDSRNSNPVSRKLTQYTSCWGDGLLSFKHSGYPCARCNHISKKGPKQNNSSDCAESGIAEGKLTSACKHLLF